MAFSCNDIVEEFRHRTGGPHNVVVVVWAISTRLIPNLTQAEVVLERARLARIERLEPVVRNGLRGHWSWEVGFREGTPTDIESVGLDRPCGVGRAVTIPARGNMSNLAEVVVQLRQQRAAAQRRVEQLGQALAVLGGVDGLRIAREEFSESRKKGPNYVGRIPEKNAAAQRARWAKWKAAQKKK